MKIKIKKYISILLVVLITNLLVSCDITNTSLNKNSSDAKEEVVVTTQAKDIYKNDENIDGYTEAKIHFINTGNSDSILIVQGDKSVLIDAGDNDDEELVYTYIKNQGIQKLTYVISTHADADHSGGLDTVFNFLDIERLFISNGSADTKTYSDFINAAATKGINPSVPLEGSIHELTDNSYIVFFNTNGGSDTNESSLVTLFVNGNDKALFMGDAGVEVENEIRSQIIDVDLVKIGHHGSKTSTSEEFLGLIKPEYAVVLTGPNNKYGHPSKETMDKLKERSIEVHRSDECGDIIFSSTGKGISTSCAKASYTPGENVVTNSEDAISSESSEKNIDTVVTSEQAKFNNENNLVIITMTGEKYHKDGCRTVKQVKDEISRKVAEEQGYRPCGICKP